MAEVDGSRRTSLTYVQYTIRCERCLLTMDVGRPRRRPRQER